MILLKAQKAMSDIDSEETSPPKNLNYSVSEIFLDVPVAHRWKNLLTHCGFLPMGVFAEFGLCVPSLEDENFLGQNTAMR